MCRSTPCVDPKLLKHRVGRVFNSPKKSARTDLHWPHTCSRTRGLGLDFLQSTQIVAQVFSVSNYLGESCYQYSGMKYETKGASAKEEAVISKCLVCFQHAFLSSMTAPEKSKLGPRWRLIISLYCAVFSTT